VVDPHDPAKKTHVSRLRAVDAGHDVAAEYDSAWPIWWPTCSGWASRLSSAYAHGRVGADLPGVFTVIAWRLNAAFWKDVK
jgi:hypothetical protein